MEDKLIETLLNLNPQEKEYLISDIELTLRQFGHLPYNGKQFTNPIMAKSFNKIFKALTGKDHTNYTTYFKTFCLEYLENYDFFEGNACKEMRTLIQSYLDEEEVQKLELKQ